MFSRKSKSILSFALAALVLCQGQSAVAQLVGLPLPRLLTLMPMGGQAGTTVEVTLTGENIESVTEMLFSTPKITAVPVKDEKGAVVENKFVLTIAPDAPIG